MNRDEYSYTATNLKQVIRSQGLRQEWVAERVGVTPATISRIVNNRRTTSVETAQRIADLLRLPLFFLFESHERDFSTQTCDREVA